MAGPSVLEPSPDVIGVTPKPPFAVLPAPKTMFSARAARFRTLAEDHPLADYLTFLAELSQVQHDIQPNLPAPRPPAAEALERALEFSMPPLDRARFDPDEAALTTLERLLDKAVAVKMPEPAAKARDTLAREPEARRTALVQALEGAPGVETLASHVFAAAALQVHFARVASGLDAERLSPVGTGACPACGGPPVASLVVGWTAAHGARFVSCALCGTMWNHVRVKCVACDSTKGIAYRELAPEDAEAEPKTKRGLRAKEQAEARAPVRAETCDECRTYVKIMHQHVVPDVDPVADDVATLGLDLKLREEGWARAAFNPYLLGY